MIKKDLVHNEQEFVALFSKFDFDALEKFLDIEFAFVDGNFQSEISNHPDFATLELQGVDTTNYKKNSEMCFPEHYPCVVLWANEKTFDRTGNIAFEMLEFVYQRDFQPNEVL